VVQAATKYIIGHSDAMLGVATCKDVATYRTLKEAANWVGHGVAPDIVWTAHRGLRTLPVRLEQHYKAGLVLAKWCETRPEISNVLHPALQSHPDHEIWKRDFSGATGLFTIQLDTTDKARAIKFVEGLRLFGMGFSWGGFESLALISDPSHARTATQWTDKRILVRLHAGLEDIDDLLEDLEQSLTAAFQ
ncbi:MAG: PLP-dependent transferase, partial [Roseovarius sp.]